MTMLNRIKQLELASRPLGRAHWISPSEPGQTLEEATAAYEAINGPIGKDDMVFHWDQFPKDIPPCA
jgi:hypothetical protein